MRKLFLIVLLGISVLTAAAADVPKGWTTDISAAFKRAKAEKKEVLVLFTGSDWCGWCIRLKKDVLDKKEFKNLAFSRFVPVYFDFPHRKKISPEQMKLQQTWQDKLNISGYPSTVILDSSGNVLRKVGTYMPLKDYLKAIYPEYSEKNVKNNKR
ncbi:MAG: thioredoxin family protein [Lentisphaerae bacterium]|nr:thioredoxin family protein [Lentisphaerota bacterium]